MMKMEGKIIAACSPLMTPSLKKAKSTPIAPPLYIQALTRSMALSPGKPKIDMIGSNAMPM